MLLTKLIYLRIQTQALMINKIHKMHQKFSSQKTFKIQLKFRIQKKIKINKLQILKK